MKKIKFCQNLKQANKMQLLDTVSIHYTNLLKKLTQDVLNDSIRPSITTSRFSNSVTKSLSKNTTQDVIKIETKL